MPFLRSHSTASEQVFKDIEMASGRSECMSTRSNGDTNYCITLAIFFMTIAIIVAGIIFHYHQVEALKEEMNSLRLEKLETELMCKQTEVNAEKERLEGKQKLWVEFQSYLEQQRDYVKKPLLDVMWKASVNGQFGDLVWLVDCFTKDDVRGYLTRLLDFLKGVSRESQCLQELELQQLKTENINKEK